MSEIQILMLFANGNPVLQTGLAVILLPSRKDNFITVKCLARNRIKYLRSLKMKKFRTQYRQFIAEGDKIVGDILKEKHVSIRQLIATGDWLK